MHFPIPPDLINLLRQRPQTVVLTGAGTSAESGVPTFRQAQTGLWAHYDPLELATPQAFERQPDLVWDWYEWRRSLVRAARPNPGHVALARLGELLPVFTLITQNVDGLHQQAGSRDVIELHGNILRTLCYDEGCEVDSWEDQTNRPPRCPNCGGLLRPGVVWFGEALPPGVLEQAWQAVEECRLFFSIGTSSLVEPAASLPYVAMQHGAQVVEINPTSTPLTQSVDYVLAGPSGEVLPALLAALEDRLVAP
jgi:NAD-dependent deacetylase